MTVSLADQGRPTVEAPRSILRRRLATFGKRKLALAVTALVVLAATALVVGPVGVLPLGLLIAYIADADETVPSRSIAHTRRNLALAASGLVVLAELALDPAYLERLPGAAFSLLFVAPLVLPLALQQSADRDSPAPARAPALTRRSLGVALWGVLLFVVAYQSDLLLGLAGLLIVLPLALGASRAWAARRGGLEYGLLRHPLRRELRAHLLQGVNAWVCCALLGAMIAAGSADAARLVLSPTAFGALIAALWAGLVLLAALALVPRRRVYVATNVLAMLVSGFLALQLGRISAPPTDAVVLASPLAGDWYVGAGGRSALLSHHYTFPAQRDTLDLLRVGADGRTHTGERSSSLASYHAFGAPLLAPADGRITAVIDSFPDQPIGGSDQDHPAGGHLVEDIGGGRYVMMAHLKQGSARVSVGQRVRRGESLARVGNSGNTSEPHLHVQVQNRPTFQTRPRFDLADFEGLRTYPMVFRDARITRGAGGPAPVGTDLRRGDLIRPL